MAEFIKVGRRYCAKRSFPTPWSAQTAMVLLLKQVNGVGDVACHYGGKTVRITTPRKGDAAFYQNYLDGLKVT